MNDLSEMDYVRAALCNALASGIDLAGVWRIAEHAETVEDFDRAIDLLTCAEPSGRGMDYVCGEWV